ncbi:uncharacterized protein LOC108485997 [Gossypium arboreum]|uniref:DNA-directed RNA polymerase III subunit RPC4 n=2 Tax=Gossypium arboreum TaxID=29729 RepID=A0ABR0PT25_GOSAR|nr:uncharacterized protein LOC108485997 [Gossypium arboreum]KAK5829979.1 hypothetical protein PVK06_013773 [Gossypium arboreum]
MEQQTNKTNAPSRKVRFAPKAPTRRAPKLKVKTEVIEDSDAVQARDLLQRLNQISAKTKPKVEKKVASSQVAFGFGAGSTSIKTFGASRGSVPTPGLREEKEYKEPWDYYSYYPVTLPMRRPYSGNPEFLDEEEFALANATFEEDSVEPAVELGLMEENSEATMFFIQLPPTLPMTKQTGNISGNETNSRSKPAASVGSAKKTCGIEELSAGFMGKMLVYRSGAVKLKLGDTLYDVIPGCNGEFSQDVVAVNTGKKHCCGVGEIDKRAILTLDVNSVFNHLTDL